MYLAMTVFRLITLPAHTALEFAGGLALMAAPFMFGFTPAGLVASVLAGALVAGISLSTSSGPSDGGLAVSAHAAFDRLFAVVLIGGALALSLHGDRAGAIALLAGSLTQLALSLITRYSART